ncbi:DNA replication licensing factor mcm8 [Cichlidogyrus casuarinus]|uniref:DNA helicase n=1 Tax=Cichlidogyrus casuarinus TaxID=1844966 RepID=A0ABD2Q645_9PLAT
MQAYFFDCNEFEDVASATYPDLSPSDLINCLSLAVHTLMQKVLVSEASSPYRLCRAITARITNHTPFSSVSELRGKHVNRFTSIQGTVVRISSAVRTCDQLMFQCKSCLEKNKWCLPSDGTFIPPISCPNKECRSKTFEPIFDSIFNKTIEQQVLTVQDSQDNPSLDITKPLADSSPLRCIDCLLSQEMVGQCLPGDFVRLSGILTLVPNNEKEFSFFKQKKETNLYNFRLVVNSFVVLRSKFSPTASLGSTSSNGKLKKNPRFLDKNFHVVNANSSRAVLCLYNNNESIEMESTQAEPCTMFSQTQLISDDPDFSIQEFNQIRTLGLRKGLFDLLVKSFCPEIIGHSEVKSGIILTILTASLENRAKDLTRLDMLQVKRRDASHLLIVGDPGLGKSQMLREAVNVAPRAIYVCGSSASAAGLTVGTVRAGADKNQQSGFCTEAGALVLADEGICCIDEFDKLSCNPSSLLETMEQQTVSIAKGAMVCNLPARASIVAVGNPISGRYDFSRKLRDNVRISEALLSRFDLLFVMHDQRDADADKRLCEHLFKKNRHEEQDLIKPHLLKKFFLYARKYINPRLSTEASQTLRNFYVDWRKQGAIHQSFPVTVRQLESLVRLSKARARAELRDTVTREDASFACNLLENACSLKKVTAPKSDFLDEAIRESLAKNLSQKKVGTSLAAETRRLFTILQQASNRSKKTSFSLSEIKKTAEALQLNSPVSCMIDHLNVKGILIKTSSTEYKFVNL